MSNNFEAKFRPAQEPAEAPDEQLSQEPSKAPVKLSRLEKLEQRKAQIEAKIKAIEKQENEKAQRKRTRRLFRIGALSEKYFNCPDISPSDYVILTHFSGDC